MRVFKGFVRKSDTNCSEKWWLSFTSFLIFAFLPSKVFAVIENSGVWEDAIFVFLIIAFLWSIGIVAVAVENEDPKLQPVLIIVLLIGVNVLLMFTSIVVLYISLYITIPILFVVLLWTYYEI